MFSIILTANGGTETFIAADENEAIMVGFTAARSFDLSKQAGAIAISGPDFFVVVAGDGLDGGLTKALREQTIIQRSILAGRI